MQVVNQIMQYICNLLQKVAATILFLVCLIVLLNVLFRNLMSAPLLGTNEIVQYGTMFAVCLVLAHVTLRDGHVKVTLFIDKFPVKIRNLVAIIMDCAGFFGFYLFFQSIIGTTREAMSSGQFTPIFQIPFYLVYIAIMVGVGLMVIVLIFKMIQKVLHLFKSQKIQC